LLLLLFIKREFGSCIKCVKKLNSYILSFDSFKLMNFLIKLIIPYFLKIHNKL